jgi:hypothetical protein
MSKRFGVLIHFFSIYYTFTAYYIKFAELINSNSLTIDYPLKTGVISVSTNYSYLTSAKSSDPEVYGLGDIEISYGNGKVFQLKNWKGSLNYALSLPTSVSSKRSSLLTSIGASLSLSQSFGKSTVGFGGSIQRSFHTYETADAAGFRQNIPCSVGLFLSPKYRLTKELSLGLLLGASAQQDYKGDIEPYQSIVASASYALTRQLGLGPSYGWGDSYYTNNPLLYLDNTRYKMSLSYVF